MNKEDLALHILVYEQALQLGIYDGDEDKQRTEQRLEQLREQYQVLVEASGSIV